jgi:hypothetical protein
VFGRDSSDLRVCLDNACKCLFIDVQEQCRYNRNGRDSVRGIGKDQRPNSKLLLVVQYLDYVPLLAQADRPTQNEEHATRHVPLFVDDVSCAWVQLFPDLGQCGGKCPVVNNHFLLT